jgi:hypothetical protein
MGFAWARGIKTLYKFRSFQEESNAWVAQILLESRIYFSHPDQFNDPFDIAPIVKHGGNPKNPVYVEELKTSQEQLYREQAYSPQEVAELQRREGVPAEELPAAATKDMRQKIRNAARILCLSSSRRDPLQWAHYANGHQGVCIHFQCQRGSWLQGARRVRYWQRRPAIQLPLSRQTQIECAHRMALTKAHFWRYEDEYRAFANRSARAEITLDGNYFYFAPSDITGITIGMSMKPADRSALLGMLNLRRQAMPIWECIEDRARFALKIRRLA